MALHIITQPVQIITQPVQHAIPVDHVAHDLTGVQFACPVNSALFTVLMGCRS